MSGAFARIKIRILFQFQLEESSTCKSSLLDCGGRNIEVLKTRKEKGWLNNSSPKKVSKALTSA